MSTGAQVAISAVIGGTAGKLGGGKPVRPDRGGFATDAIITASGNCISVSNSNELPVQPFL